MSPRNAPRNAPFPKGYTGCPEICNIRGLVKKEKINLSNLLTFFTCL